MVLKRRTSLVNYGPLIQASAGLQGTSQPVPIDRQWPLEEIHITVGVTAGATGPTFASATTPVILDNIMGTIKKIRLTVADGKEPRDVVNITGAGAIEWAFWQGFNLSAATLGSVGLSQGSSIANNLKYRIHYRIPLVPPRLGEPLRSRCLLPVHTLIQDPVLTLDFANSSDYASAGTIAALLCEVRLVRRLMDNQTTDAILKAGGFIPFDIVETPLPVAANAAGETNFDIPLGGQYSGLLFRTYLGGASTVTRDVLDQTTTLGNETKWILTSGGVTHEEFRMRSLQDMGDLANPLNSQNQTYSPSFAGAVAAGTTYQPASSVYLDFLGDGLGFESDLGSLLDCNIPPASGLKMQLRGNVSNGATAGQLNIVGQRHYGNLLPWQSAAQIALAKA